jgi:hypothetical protein
MMTFVREIDNGIYSRKALADTRDAYHSYCDVQALPLPNNRAKITLVVKNQYLSDSNQIILEFWNYFLDSACKDYLESE